MRAIASAVSTKVAQTKIFQQEPHIEAPHSQLQQFDPDALRCEMDPVQADRPSLSDRGVRFRPSPGEMQNGKMDAKRAVDSE